MLHLENDPSHRFPAGFDPNNSTGGMLVPTLTYFSVHFWDTVFK